MVLATWTFGSFGAFGSRGALVAFRSLGGSRSVALGGDGLGASCGHDVRVLLVSLCVGRGAFSVAHPGGEVLS